MWFYFQYEVKAPVPSACFRNICKQMAKMHEAIYDLLPEEQTQVNVIFEIQVTPPMQVRMNWVTGETSALYRGEGNSFLSLCEAHTLKGLAAVTLTARSELKEVFGCAGRMMRHAKELTDASVLSGILVPREVNQFRN